MAVARKHHVQSLYNKVMGLRFCQLTEAGQTKAVGKEKLDEFQVIYFS